MPMNSGKLVLMPVFDKLAPVTQAVMYEVPAAKYVMFGIRDFRKLVHEGVIICRNHPGRTRRIYLKADLDDYLRNLTQSNMVAGRVHPGPGGKGDLRWPIKSTTRFVYRAIRENQCWMLAGPTISAIGSASLTKGEGMR